MHEHYANITLRGPTQDAVLDFLNRDGQVAYVAPSVHGCTVVFHSDLAEQEALTARLSRVFECPALLVMGFARSILMYHLYAMGEQTDAYISSPHDQLDLDGPAPAGDASRLCAAMEIDRQALRVQRLLDKPAGPGNAYELAANRHGELCQALRLPIFAAGASYQLIELGELPHAIGFEDSKLIATSGRR